MRATPPMMHGRKLPPEVHGIANTGVHAEPAIWRHHVHGIAREPHAAASIAVGDDAPARPVTELDDLERHVAPDRAAYLRHGIDRARIGVRLAVDHQAPEITSVG